MTRHLSDVERMAAADGGLDPTRLAHVEACEACRRDVDHVRAFLAEVAAAGVPEPSPLFWEHFSQRVRQATRHVPVRESHGWVPTWRAWSSLLATAAAVVLAVWVVRQPGNNAVPFADPVRSDTESLATSGPDEVEWESVVAMTAAWSDDQLFDWQTADESVLFDELTTEERAAFVRLVRQEMAVLQ